MFVEKPGQEGDGDVSHGTALLAMPCYSFGGSTATVLSGFGEVDGGSPAYVGGFVRWKILLYLRLFACAEIHVSDT